MVSNVLNMETTELLTLLRHWSEEYKDDPEYLALRAELPPEWSI
jgi:hypothetical protein